MFRVRANPEQDGYERDVPSSRKRSRINHTNGTHGLSHSGLHAVNRPQGEARGMFDFRYAGEPIVAGLTASRIVSVADQARSVIASGKGGFSRIDPQLC